MADEEKPAEEPVAAPSLLRRTRRLQLRRTHQRPASPRRHRRRRSPKEPPAARQQQRSHQQTRCPPNKLRRRTIRPRLLRRLSRLIHQQRQPRRLPRRPAEPPADAAPAPPPPLPKAGIPWQPSCAQPTTAGCRITLLNIRESSPRVQRLRLWRRVTTCAFRRDADERHLVMSVCVVPCARLCWATVPGILLSLESAFGSV